MINAVISLIAQLRSDRRGVTALEYGLIASLVAVVLIAGAATLGGNLNSTFSSIAGSI